ncbi:amino acid ABC transporter permease [Cellulosilyticum lentocellum]|uniref:Polar amino acid ABC transporter, inner membrane subunit n=1 Tax=Cellulosilyticum lentocellum (strain ATCC 49066 / DSM 5427 / NCIMB 11756 / RHM5) TaxID=642492 RepID=F2JSB6_CELLD|nr:amino acid ABC transporter permease [Cellulosilyticum lentocellum]ADZ85154.1 polar amino acid ABC transporter, inner membrane subunit [Cellulosilyticum lentocellum DSM 5427]
MHYFTNFYEMIVEFFSTVLNFMPKFLPGVWMTLQLSFYSILLGTLFGLLATILKLSKKKILMQLIDCYITIVRGTPLLLQLIFIFSALPQLGIEFDSFSSAIIGLAFHSGAYISEIFRGAIESIDKGQNEAAKALGMTKLQAMRRIILPQAFKRSIPALGNQFIIAIKDSSLASAITITEIIMLTRQYASIKFDAFPIFFVAALYYLIITLSLTKLLAYIEKRLKVNER